MSDFNRGYSPAAPGTADMSVDAGLRAFMLGVYNKMALGLLLSAFLAWLTADFAPVTQLLYITTPSGALAGFTPLGMIIRFAPLAIILFAMFGMRNPSPRSSGILYWTVVTAIGAGLGVWILAYTGASVAQAFLITASAFGALSLFGYSTKRNLSGLHSFLFMGAWGIVIAGLFTFIFRSPMFYFVLNVMGVIVFAGLVATQTQRLKMTYYELGGDQAAMSVATNYGALNLYIAFINLFQFLLALLGGRRS